MMIKLVRSFLKYAKFSTVFPLLIIGFSLQALLIMDYLPDFLRHSDGAKNPDQLFTYDLEYLTGLYQKLGEEGRKFYIKMLGVDFLYTIISGIGYSFLLSALVKKERWYILLPLFLTLSDVFENISQLVLMNNFPAISATGVFISSTLTSIKMTGGAICLSLILFFIAKTTLNWWNNKKTNI